MNFLNWFIHIVAFSNLRCLLFIPKRIMLFVLLTDIVRLVGRYDFFSDKRAFLSFLFYVMIIYDSYKLVDRFVLSTVINFYSVKIFSSFFFFFSNDGKRHSSTLIITQTSVKATRRGKNLGSCRRLKGSVVRGKVS